ncbi:XdhC family protein [Sphingosinicella rhizophila]|uniref:XdhC family protein n=1 Tax=Sphingosinicella rhizophila TaxID=3050082 RepID=A0ABU3Q6S8_9SPHN|nr:XdhC family protein [Sphingosinicella sp. GR2756]MDT9598804.1 XdhC family protein [Sphingosinicella sp. GR2756]
MDGPAEIFSFLTSGSRAGRRGALVTITGLSGPSPRSLGAHMAVLDDGRTAGTLSSGCVEAAISAEALVAIAEKRSRPLRFGTGSPFIDVRLPCGGGMDVLISVDPPGDVLRDAADLLFARSPAALSMDVVGNLSVAASTGTEETGWREDRFTVRHDPKLRILVLGQGAEALAMMELANAFGADAELHSPDRTLFGAIDERGFQYTKLLSISEPAKLSADRWTAIAFLFHDHDWEIALLPSALGTSSFWIGAMGSERTHAARLTALSEQGISKAGLARIAGPIGLIPASRDPATLALSALAEIVQEFGRLTRRPDSR